jgi:hypothetical protein
MREFKISAPELALIGATRAALGAGLGLLIADLVSRDRRSAIGWTLISIGALSTIPLAFEIFGRVRPEADPQLPDQAEAGHTGSALGTLRTRKSFVW